MNSKLNSKPHFPHRHNNDGTFDSICDTCFKILARVKSEAELMPFEVRHVCDPVNLYWANQRADANTIVARGAADTSPGSD